MKAVRTKGKKDCAGLDRKLRVPGIGMRDS
jgi:hypothetical protein